MDRANGSRNVQIHWQSFLSLVQENTRDWDNHHVPSTLPEREGLLFHLPVYPSSSCLCPSLKIIILALSHLKTGSQGIRIKQKTGASTKCKLYYFNSLYYSYSVENSSIFKILYMKEIWYVSPNSTIELLQISKFIIFTQNELWSWKRFF